MVVIDASRAPFTAGLLRENPSQFENPFPTEKNDETVLIEMDVQAITD
jgi:hypothetical protein